MVSTEAKAVALATAHVEAWSQHNWDDARKLLADDVKVTATSTQPGLPKTSTVGADDYMSGLIQFAQAVVPGSLTINARIGDERNALLMVTVRAKFPGAPGEVTLPGGRLYLFDDDGKLQSEQVIFALLPD
jgi:hypothetical protein